MTFTQILMASGGVLGTAILATFLIPSKVHVERTAFVPKPPEAVIALAAANAGVQQCIPYKTSDPNLAITMVGPETGVGSGVRFEGKEGKGKQTVVSVTDGAVTYAIDLGSMGQPTQSIRVAAAQGGSTVTWDMDADMGLNPIARVFGLFMDRIMGKTLDQGLQNLAKA